MVDMDSIILWVIFLSIASLAKIIDREFELLAAGYDFIVVGGGTAGNVIANRLTEKLETKVLILEAGGSNDGVLNSVIPFYCSRLTPTTPYDWNFTTSPQAGLGGRSIPYPRGHILGGSSSVNFMAYTRGSAEDFDQYAKLTGDPSWTWERLQPYIQRNERWSAPADRHNTSGQFDPSVHGYSGINSVSLAGFPRSINDMVIQAIRELEDFPFNLDMNSGKQLGIGWVQATIRGGRRSSSATSYLGPKYMKRPNLHVLLHSQVTRVLQTSTQKNRRPSFHTVEYVQNVPGGHGIRMLVTATKEIILSAGSIGTPHILLNSGIGDQVALSSVGIKVIHHLPSVGQNLSDHPSFGNAWFVNSTDTFETLSRNATLVSLAGFDCLAMPPFLGPYADPAPGPDTAHFEFVIGNGIVRNAPPTGNFMGIGTVVTTPLSRGSVTLNSSNPLDHPNIDPGLLNHEFDIFTMREAVRKAHRFVAAPAFHGYILQPFGNISTIDINNDTQLDRLLRLQTSSIFHPVGTASMSPKNANYGVVDPGLKIKGVDGLRIVDASVIPFVPSAHTQAPAYIIAERGADLIKASWG